MSELQAVRKQKKKGDLSATSRSNGRRCDLCDEVITFDDKDTEFGAINGVIARRHGPCVMEWEMN